MFPGYNIVDTARDRHGLILRFPNDLPECGYINRRWKLTTLHSFTQGISKNLVSRAFPETERPDYLTSDEFLKFTPTDDFMSLPGEILRTEFRLVVIHDGWEYTVLERELGAHRDPLRKMLVTVSALFGCPLVP